MAKQRLDTYLVEQGLCDSRQQAQRCIRAGEVKVDEAVIDKPGTPIKPGAVVVLRQKSPYVSRGGEKLAKALAEFGVSVCDRICLDGGISTGGFTDCLLQQGARQVYGIDVGYGQVAWKSEWCCGSAQICAISPLRISTALTPSAPIWGLWMCHLSPWRRCCLPFGSCSATQENACC